MSHASALLQQAEFLLDDRALELALECFDEAERNGASANRCSAGRWMAWMLLGRFEEAWRESDCIRTRGEDDPHRFWNGEDITGKRVIVRCLHGLGDAVQMLRFVPALRERCTSLVIEAAPSLLELARCFDGVEQVVTWGALAPACAPEWDLQMEIMELPYMLRVVSSQLPSVSNYLQIPGVLQRRTVEMMGQRRQPRVGLVWAAGDWNPSRSVPHHLLTELLAIPHCEFWNLQGGVEQSRWPSLVQAHALTRDAAEFGNGPLQLAAVIEQLDLVITVDTLAAHLAGALGTPAWVLLQHAADWRWMVDRTDTPWYPSLTLYRQSRPGDWAGLLSRVGHDLNRWLMMPRSLELAS